MMGGAWLTGRCRCAVCHRALLEYSRLRRAVASVAAGREPVPRVPAARARRRVVELRRAGWSVAAIAAAAGVSYSTVERIASRRLARVALPTQRRVLSVWP
jgi:DNA invertase Pin-like site-specific DNA recombinase